MNLIQRWQPMNIDGHKRDNKLGGTWITRFPKYVYLLVGEFINKSSVHISGSNIPNEYSWEKVFKLRFYSGSVCTQSYRWTHMSMCVPLVASCNDARLWFSLHLQLSDNMFVIECTMHCCIHFMREWSIPVVVFQSHSMPHRSHHVSIQTD